MEAENDARLRVSIAGERGDRTFAELHQPAGIDNSDHRRSCCQNGSGVPTNRRQARIWEQKIVQPNLFEITKSCPRLDLRQTPHRLARELPYEGLSAVNAQL